MGIGADVVVGTVTVTATLAVEALKLLVPPYAAVMLFDPVTSLFPATLIDAVAVPPDPESAADPSDVFPDEKSTDPEGVVVPLAALTVAVILVLEVTGMLAGFAETEVVDGTVACPVH